MKNYSLNYVKKKYKKLENIYSNNTDSNKTDILNKLKSWKEFNINTKDYDKLNLRENGVEYVKVNTKILKNIKKLSKYSFLTNSSKLDKNVVKVKNELEDDVNKFLFNFLKSKSRSGIKNFPDNFTDIVIIETSIRNSTINKFNLVDSKVNAAPRLPENLANLFTNPFFRMSVIFLIAYTLSKNHLIALIATIILVLLMQTSEDQVLVDVNAAASWFHTDWWEGQSFSSMLISRFSWLKKLNKYAPKKYTNLSNIPEWSCFGIVNMLN